MIGVKERNEYAENFLKTFHFELKEVVETIFSEKLLIGVDIIKFEERMKKKGYKEDKSLKDFVKETYGEEANILIDKLL